VLPRTLAGTYVRNGPNRGRDEPRGLWFTGPGMLHAVRIEAGRAWYGCRRVGTVDAPASAGLVRHGEALLALSDFGAAVRVDARTLAPLGADAPRTVPHAVVMPASGALVTLATDWDGDDVRIVERGRDGSWRQRGCIALPARPFLHDVALVDDRLVVLDLPWRRGPRGPRWVPEHGARVGLTDLDGRDTRWFDVTAGYVSHVAATRRDGDTVEVDVCRRPVPGVSRDESNPYDHGPASLRRWTIDLSTGRVREDDVDARACDFPVPSVDGAAVYVTRPAFDNYTVAGAVARVDLRTGAVTSFDFGPARLGGEVQAVATGDGSEVLVGFVYDTASEGSELVVLDASRPADAPLATIAVPGRVPWGLHGTWLAGV
jgi:carotenoid cleavage dioxygenase